MEPWLDYLLRCNRSKPSSQSTVPKPRTLHRVTLQSSPRTLHTITLHSSPDHPEPCTQQQYMTVGGSFTEKQGQRDAATARSRHSVKQPQREAGTVDDAPGNRKSAAPSPAAGRTLIPSGSVPLSKPMCCCQQSSDEATIFSIDTEPLHTTHQHMKSGMHCAEQCTIDWSLGRLK